MRVTTKDVMNVIFWMMMGAWIYSISIDEPTYQSVSENIKTQIHLSECSRAAMDCAWEGMYEEAQHKER